MKTKAVRLYGKNDLRLEEFELPPMREDEILAKVYSDSICMSTYKTAIQGEDHKRVPKGIPLSKRPVMMGHEFCGEIVEVGRKWKDAFSPGEKFTMQTALNYKGTMDAPGFSFPYVGGDATYMIIPNVVMELNCLLKYQSDDYYHGSLTEPMGCIIGAFHANYHTKAGSYVHEMGVREGGKMALLASVGPMGLGAIDYALHCDRRPSLLVVTDIDEARLQRAASIYTVEEAARCGIKLKYLNTSKMENPVKEMRKIAGGGFDDVFVFAPVKGVVEQADAILGKDGCLNFFAGPTDQEFSAEMNFYNVHYAATHIVGTSGGNTEDMREAIQLMNQGKIDPSAMITHIGGLNAVIPTTLNLPNIPGGKKLIYNQIDLPLTALTDFAELGKKEPMFRELAEIIGQNNGLWCGKAERYLLAHAKKLI